MKIINANAEYTFQRPNGSTVTGQVSARIEVLHNMDGAFGLQSLTVRHLIEKVKRDSNHDGTVSLSNVKYELVESSVSVVESSP